MKKSITKNYIYNVLYQLFVIIVPLITTPYVSRVLGSEGIGIYSYTISIATYFVLFGSLGIAMYGQREIAYVRDDKNETSKVFWEIFILRIFTMTISGIVFFFTFCTDSVQYHIYYRILILELIGNVIDISWFFQGLEEFKKTISRNLIVKLIGIVCIFTFVKSSEDLYKYILIYVLSNLLGNVTLWLYLPKFITTKGINKLNVIKHLKPTISLFIPQIAMQIYTVLDKTMLGSILGDMNQVGNYEQSQKIIKMSLTIVTAIGTVVSPRIANTIANKNMKDVKNYLAKSFRFVWLIGTPIMFGLIGISDTLVKWFLGDGYEQSAMLLKIGSLLIMAIGLNNVSGMQYLVPAKKQNIFTKTVVIGASVNFLLNLALIKTLKAEGAIIASVIAESVIFLAQVYYIRKDFDISIIHKGCMKYILAGLIMFIPISIIGHICSATMTTTFIQIICGIVVYGVALIILKDEFLLKILSKFKSRLMKSPIEKQKNKVIKE